MNALSGIKDKRIAKDVVSTIRKFLGMTSEDALTEESLKDTANRCFGWNFEITRGCIEAVPALIEGDAPKYKWQKLFDDFENGNNTNEIDRAKELFEPIFAEIQKEVSIASYKAIDDLRNFAISKMDDSRRASDMAIFKNIDVILNTLKDTGR